MVQYTETLTESVALATPIATRRQVSATDYIMVEERNPPRFSPGAAIADSLAHTDTAAFLYRRGPSLIESLRLAEAFAFKLAYAPVVTERTRLTDQTQLAFLRAVTDSIAATTSVSVARLMVITERLGLTEAVLAKTRYGTTVGEALRFMDALGRFISGVASETLTVTDTASRVFKAPRTGSEALAITDSVTPKLVLRLTARETLNLSSVNILKLLYRPVIADAVELVLGYVAPDGNFTSWAVNIRTGAATEYTNYEFNSFGQMGRTYLGASSSGLYELLGDDDAGDDIIAKMKTGLIGFADKPVSFKAIYFGIRGGGEFFIKVDNGDGRETTYKIIAQDMDTTRLRLGKGLRAQFYAFELESTGQDFDLDGIEFVPLASARRN